MTYETNAAELGKTPAYFLEVDFRACGSFYGLGTCTATGADGLRCFNAFQSCQDKINFDGDNPSNNTIKTIRFSNMRLDSLQQPGDPATFPILRSVTTTPTKLTPGKGLGIRSTLSVSLGDMPWNDTGLDKYLLGRTYNPDDQGSLIGKILARYPFYEGSEGRLFTGYLEEDGSINLANFKKRTYLLHRISGPDYNGGAQFEFKDPLKAADADRAQWPLPTTATLVTDINSTVTNISVNDAQGDLVQWFIDQPTQQYIIIDKEVMFVVSYVQTSTLDLIVQRPTMPTYYEAATNEAADHSTGSSVQQCYEYDNIRIDNIIYQLLNEASGIDAAFLPLVDWQTVINESGYISYTLSALLIKPTGVKKLLEELTQLNISIWWDERTQTIPMSTLVLLNLNSPVYNESDHIIDGSIRITRDVKERVSRVLLGYGLRNPTADMKLTTSYQAVEYKVDLDAESVDEYDQKKTLSVFSRWLTVFQRPVASEVSNRTLINNRDTKQIASLSLTPKDDAQWTGDIVDLETRLISDQYGAIKKTSFQVTEVSEGLKNDDIVYSYLLREISSVARSGLITPNEDPDTPLHYDGDDVEYGTDNNVHYGSSSGGVFPDYTDADQALRDRYAFIAYNHAPDPPADLASPPGFNDGTLPYSPV